MMNQTIYPIAPTYALSDKQRDAIVIIERVTSIVSIFSTSLMMLLFLTICELRHKPFNRLIFLAAWGNILTNIATVIGRSAVTQGTDCVTCKVQATLIQWFLPADTLWMFCMAVNVFLTFKTTTIHVNIQKVEKWYFLFCYGVPAVPALTYLISDYTRGTNFYGDAVLWCWISKDHDALRIFTLYGPVWIFLFITMALYAITGRAILKGLVRNVNMRNELGNEHELTHSANPSADFDLHSLTKRTVICQTSERVESPTDSKASTAVIEEITNSIQTTPSPSSFRHISIRIPGFEDGTQVPGFAITSSGKSVVTTKCFASPETPISPHPPFHTFTPTSSSFTRSYTPDSEKSTQSTPHAKSISSRITTFTTGATAAATARRSNPNSRSTTNRTNRGARQYAIVALLLYIVMLIVWVPSTVNRVYGIATASKNMPPRFGLALAAAVVLPLQGFLNSFIFCFTSRNELRARIRLVSAKMTLSKKEEIPPPFSSHSAFERAVNKTRNWPLASCEEEEKEKKKVNSNVQVAFEEV